MKNLLKKVLTNKDARKKSRLAAIAARSAGANLNPWSDAQ